MKRYFLKFQLSTFEICLMDPQMSFNGVKNGLLNEFIKRVLSLFNNSLIFLKGSLNESLNESINESLNAHLMTS